MVGARAGHKLFFLYGGPAGGRRGNPLKRRLSRPLGEPAADVV
jgi:hypothetical protein